MTINDIKRQDNFSRIVKMFADGWDNYTIVAALDGWTLDSVIKAKSMWQMQQPGGWKYVEPDNILNNQPET